MAEAAAPAPDPALWVAACRGQTEEVRQRLLGGANIEERGHKQSTPLQIAAAKGRVEVVQLLLENGADTSATDDMGWTPLHQAASQGHAEVAKVLLENGADVSARRGSGAMPLQDAVSFENEAVVEVLLEHGADVNGTDTSAEDGWTMLHLAAFKGLAEVAKLLLQHGANILAENNARQTARFVANFQSHHEVVAILQEATVTRAKCVAFAMGHHKRLGVGSLVAPLDAEVVRMVLQLVV
jgi:ankyrin repeat protein